MTFKCKFSGLVLPLFGEGEMDWPNPVRLILYLMGLGWTFLGVAVISDVFMAGIEKVTSAKRRVTNKETGRTVTVYVWNATVANLTLMALGSSAPEILLSVIEITTGKFMLGALGAGTIVGSAAFNLLIIAAVCVMAIPEPEIRYIKEVPVYIVTASCSVFAYLWLMFILMVTSPDVCEIWEAVVTLLFCPILVLVAYMADRGYCSRRSAGGAEDLDSKNQAMPDNVSEEELAQIEADIRKEHGGASLSSDQVIKIMQAQYFSHRSRAYYRHAAMEANLHGKRLSITPVAPPDLTISEALGTGDTIEQEKKANQCEIGFACEKYAFAESIGNAKVIILRTGSMHCRCSVNYATREGTAKEESDYVPVKGTLTFEKDESSKTVEVVIKDDVAFELDEEFYIDLSDPQCLEPEPSVLGEEKKPETEEDRKAEKCTAVLSSVPIVTVVIIDDDLPGDLRMKAEEVEVTEGDKDIEVEVHVERFNGATGKIKCEYRTDNMSAVDGVDYAGAKGVLEFDTNVVSQTIPVTIRPRGIIKERTFNLVIHTADGCNFDSKTDGGEEECICHVTIKGKSGDRKSLMKDMRSRMISANAIMGSKNWAQQFKDALFSVGDDEEDGDDSDADAKRSGPSAMDYFIHIVSVPWKLLFAFVPPSDYCGGWACFCGALFMIAIVTALVGDMANLVGCCLDILPETAAITFVALGTSLPDTFASKTAAMMDPYADASIGNITGSNSINVFMGIGLAWCLAAFRWETGEPDEDWNKMLSHLTLDQLKHVGDVMEGKGGHAVFVTPAGTIWFNLMVFSVNAFFALQHLYARRKRFGGELGGPRKGMFGQYFSASFLMFQWFIYVTASIIFARTGDSALSYGQIADRE